MYFGVFFTSVQDAALPASLQVSRPGRQVWHAVVMDISVSCIALHCMAMRSDGEAQAHSTVQCYHPIPKPQHLFFFITVWTLHNRSVWHGCLFCSGMGAYGKGNKSSNTLACSIPCWRTALLAYILNPARTAALTCPFMN
jgi:hypothetical protein